MLHIAFAQCAAPGRICLKLQLTNIRQLLHFAAHAFDLLAQGRQLDGYLLVQRVNLQKGSARQWYYITHRSLYLRILFSAFGYDYTSHTLASSPCLFCSSFSRRSFVDAALSSCRSLNVRSSLISDALALEGNWLLVLW